MSHDNRALWGGLPVARFDMAYDADRDLVYGTRDGKSFASRGTVARGYLSALAKALGVELHPAGTAERLQELEEPRPDDDCLVRALMNMANDETAIARNAQRACNQAAEDSHQANANNLREAARYICRLEARVQALEARPATGAIDYEKVRETVPELEPYSDYDIGGIPTILHYVCEVHPEGLQNCGWVGLCTVHGYIEWAHERACLTTKGIRALTAIDACRAEPAATQPTPTPDPEWSEPVSQMSWERCRAVAELLGASLTTYRQCNGGYNCRLVPLRSTSSDIDMASGSWSTEIIAAQCGLMEVAQRIGRLDRHDHATGHINLAGLEVHQ